MTPVTPVPQSNEHIHFDKQFYKDWKYLEHNSYRNKFYNVLLLFQKKPFDITLRNHQLKGKYEGVRSIDVTGDVRAFYIKINETFVFLRIGTHAYLYH